MISRISHLGIAVKDLNAAKEIYRKLLKSEPGEPEFVADQKVNVIKFKIGEITIELLEGTSADSPVSKFIEKKGEGIHHIAFESDDIKSELIRLQNEGFEMINDVPVRGSDNMLIGFIKPKSTAGTLTEICQH